MNLTGLTIPSCARMSACTRGRGRRRQRQHRRGIRRVAQRRQILAQHPVIGPEVVAPLRDAMRLVDGDQRQLALGQHLGKSGHAQPLRRDEQELQIAVADNRAHLTRRAALQAGVNARHAQAQRRSLAAWSSISAISGEITSAVPPRAMAGNW